MTGKFLKRLDVGTISEPSGIRGYGVKAFEEANLPALELAINTYLLAAPGTLINNVHLVSIQYEHHGTGGNAKVSALVLFYYAGATTPVVP